MNFAFWLLLFDFWLNFLANCWLSAQNVVFSLKSSPWKRLRTALRSPTPSIVAGWLIKDSYWLEPCLRGLSGRYLTNVASGIPHAQTWVLALDSTNQHTNVKCLSLSVANHIISSSAAGNRLVSVGVSLHICIPRKQIIVLSPCHSMMRSHSVYRYKQFVKWNWQERWKFREEAGRATAGVRCDLDQRGVREG